MTINRERGRTGKNNVQKIILSWVLSSICIWGHSGEKFGLDHLFFKSRKEYDRKKSGWNGVQWIVLKDSSKVSQKNKTDTCKLRLSLGNCYERLFFTFYQPTCLINQCQVCNPTPRVLYFSIVDKIVVKVTQIKSGLKSVTRETLNDDEVFT